MNLKSLKLFLVVALVPSALAAQDTAVRHRHQPEIDTTRIGVMSPIVVQQRLRLLGYSRVAIVENVRSHVRANAFRSGRAVAVKYDPHSGKTTALPGRFERTPRGLLLVRPDGSAIVPPNEPDQTPRRQ